LARDGGNAKRILEPCRETVGIFALAPAHGRSSVRSSREIARGASSFELFGEIKSLRAA